jgi:Helix-turn-helix domain
MPMPTTSGKSRVGLIMVIRQEGNSLKELEALQKIVPFGPFGEIKALHPFDLNTYYSALEERILATSYGMGWKRLQAVRMESPGGEFSAVITPSTHVLGLSLPPPEKMDLRYARQFKAATGLPPHQYVITRRVERAQHLLRAGGELGLAEVALRVGFPDQSHFSLHFKRIVGVTPRQFRISARIGSKNASSGKNSDAESY